MASKIINGKQCTIVWFIGDNKLFHMKNKVNDEIIKNVLKWGYKGVLRKDSYTLGNEYHH